MKTYIITYDLLNPGQDYTGIHDAIKALGAWAHPLESFWLINSNLTATEIRDALKTIVDANDKIFVATVGDSWAGWNLGQKIYDWLKENWMSDRVSA